MVSAARKVVMDIKVNRSNAMSNSLSVECLNATLKKESARHIHQQPQDDICPKPGLPCGGSLGIGKCIWCLAGVCRA